MTTTPIPYPDSQRKAHQKKLAGLKAFYKLNEEIVAREFDPALGPELNAMMRKGHLEMRSSIIIQIAQLEETIAWAEYCAVYHKGKW